ncbi:MAG: T9SS type A sorting domain-containing protein [Bacteroidetes bacterium]|nr:T9SS type A sorting domain-containing protein [Bacteroidota bacterium]
MKSGFKILFVFIFISVFNLTNDNVRCSEVTVTIENNGISPGSVNLIAGDIVNWVLKDPGEFHIVCDGVNYGTVLPSGAENIDVFLNQYKQSSSYAINQKGVYGYKVFSQDHEFTGKITAGSPLPVELTDFVATTIKNEVILDWSTGGEINNDRFEVQRIDVSNLTDYNPEKLTFNTVGIINGNGTSNEHHHYSFTDRNLKSGKYLYRLKQIDYNSNFIYHFLSDEIVIGIPAKFYISQNYPNPFNPTTSIGYEIPEDGNVVIALFNSIGTEVKVLENSSMKAGYHYITLNGTDLPSGAYFYRINYISSGFNKSITRKMLLIK